MLQVKSLVLNLFLLVLGIPLDLSPDGSHKGGRFSKTLPEKSFKFILSKRYGIITFNLRFVLLPLKVNYIPKEQSRKKYTLRAFGTSRIKIIFAILTKIVAFYMRASIVYVGILCFLSPILGYEIGFVIFLASNKRF